ncbi:MAG: Asp-tRNA(Asn)/Glu-tRNA(Gln) amidotransferase subunit GatA [Candidatus Omnitrophota bacterium]
MENFDITNLTAHEILEKKLDTALVCKKLKEHISQVDNKVKAYISFEDTQKNGLPIAIKDNICVKGELTTCASKILQGFRPPYNATVIEKLAKANIIPFGKVNMDEFAFGSSCENSCYFPTHNPWDLERVPGGSSGGSAAAVASGLAIWALGSDTGGSIRQPASFCGVVGLKPTYGRVSRFGLIAFASSLDQIGPITKDVADAALLLNVISGYDPNDSTSANIAVEDFTKSLVNNVEGIRIGIPKEYFLPGIDTEVKKNIFEAIELLRKKGAIIKDINLPHTEYAVEIYYIIATAEASSNLGRFDGVRFGKQAEGKSMIEMVANTRGLGFGNEVKRRIFLGTFVLSHGYYDAYYKNALKARTLVKNDFDKAFDEVDCIITPTSPTPAFRIGEKLNDPLSMYLSDICTINVNLAGIPAMSLPCGFTKQGLPIGLQIMAKAFNEEVIFKTAYSYEQSTTWHKQKPKIE